MSIYSTVDIDAIVKRIGPVAREYANESEQQRNLAQPVVDVMIEQKAFKTMTPSSLGGLELDPVSFHCIIEELSVWDASAGWCVWIPGTGAWGSSDADDDVAEERLGPVDACGAGALFPPAARSLLKAATSSPVAGPIAAVAATPPPSAAFATSMKTTPSACPRSACRRCVRWASAATKPRFLTPGT